MILVDSNVPMYLIGASHPRKIDAQQWLERLVVDRELLVTDAEVFQEILHRYRTIGRPDAIQPAFDALLLMVDQVLPVDLDAVTRARDELLGRWALSARDAIHIAIMRQHDIDAILSFDRGFDAVPGIRRLGD